MRKNIITAIIILFMLLFYFFSFGFIYSVSPNANGMPGFTLEILKTLMAAGVLGILTSAIFIFQSSIEDKNTKKQDVFREKLKFYSEVVHKIETIEKDDQVDVDELKAFQFLIFRSALISNPKFSNALTEYYEFLHNNSGSLSDTEEDTARRKNAIMTLLVAARDDLAVQDAISENDKNIFKDFVVKISSNSSELSNSQSKARNIRTKEEKQKIIDEYNSIKTGRSKWLMQKHGLHPSYIVTWNRQLGKGTDT